MASKKDPVFRKIVIPWYHSKTAYIIVILCMLLVFLFSVAGISVASEFEEYSSYIWVPSLLMVLSAMVLVSASYRLLKRYFSRSSNRFLS
jgi:hypothetical protein